MKVYYWQGIINPQEFSDYDAVIAKLLQGDWRGADLEQLAGHSIYSVRLNQKARLLFATVMIDDKPYILLLEALDNHEYHKSKFLQPATLKKYLEANAIELSDTLQFKTVHSIPGFQPIQQHAPSSTDDDDNQTVNLELTPLSYFNDLHIEFNATQLAALRQLPVVVSGDAGTGKSCVSLALLAQTVRHYTVEHANQTIHLLYVTQLASLRERMQAIWQTYPESQNNPHVQVHFKTYAELALEQNQQLAKRARLTKDDFSKWLSDYANKFRKQAEIKVVFADIDKIHQEFRIICAHDFQQYAKLGKRECLFPQNQREIIFTTYHAFRKHFLATHYDEAFEPIKPDQFHVIVVDESQDLSHFQLYSLWLSALNRRICYFIDTHQSLQDGLSQRPFLLGLMTEFIKHTTHIQLPVCYRCPPFVIELANLLIQLKNTLTGGAVDKLAVQRIESAESVQNEENAVHWYASLDNDTKTALVAHAQSADFAVVTLAEYVTEAQLLYSTPQVFTLKEIKGLEHKVVLLHRLFESETLKTINSELKDVAQLSLNEHRPKDGKQQLDFGPSLNVLITAVTRTKKTLIVFQPETQHCKHILKFVKPRTLTASKLTTTSIQNTDEVAWNNAIQQQKNVGNTEFAAKISKAKIKQPATPAKERIKDKVPANNPVATNSTSLSMQMTVGGKLPSILSLSVREFYLTFSVVPKNNRNEWLTKLYREIIANPDLAVKWIVPVLVMPNTIGTGIPLLPIICAYRVGVLILKFILDRANDTNADLNKNLMAALITSIDTTIPPALFFIADYAPCLQSVSRIISKAKLKIQLSDSQLFNDYSTEINCLFDQLCHNQAGTEFLALALNQDKTLVHRITGAHLCKINPTPTDKGSSPFYWLCANASGSLILDYILFHNPNIALQITGVAICRTIHSDNIANTQLSALFFLCIAKQNRRIFSLLLEKNPNLALEITAQALCRMLTPAADNLAYVAPIHSLCTFDDGFNIFGQLVLLNPNIAKEMNAEVLCRPETIKYHNDEKISLLFALSATWERQMILLKLFEDNRKLASGITAEALSRTSKLKEVNFENTSALYFLCKSPKLALLNFLLVINPDLVRQIPSEAWTRCATVKENSILCISPIYLLTRSAAGIKILNFLVNINPDIFTVDCLCRPIDNTINSLDCALNLLCSETGGVTLLLDLFILRPKLLKEMPQFSVDMAIKEYHDKISGNNPDVILQHSDAGKKLMELLSDRNKSELAVATSSYKR